MKRLIFHSTRVLFTPTIATSDFPLFRNELVAGKVSIIAHLNIFSAMPNIYWAWFPIEVDTIPVPQFKCGITHRI